MKKPVRDKFLRKVAVLQAKVTMLELTAHRLPREVEDEEIEAEEAEDFFFPGISELIRDTEDLATLIERWNPLPIEVERRAREQEKRLGMPNLRVVK